MANTVKLKRSAVEGRVPSTSDLELGEIGINTHDGKVFVKKDDGTASVVEASSKWTRTGTTLSPATAGDVVEFSAGTAARPGLTPVGDVNTGFFAPAGDTISAATGGSERMRIDSSGRILTGTSSTSANVRALFQGTSSGANPCQMMISTGASTPSVGATLGKLQFTDSGHTPAAEIDIQRDGGTWTSGVSQPTRFLFATTADGSATPTERMLIDSSGNALIGGTLPSAPNITLTAAGAGSFKTNVDITGTLGTATVDTQLGNVLDVNDFAITTTVTDGDIDLNADGAGLIKVTEYDLGQLPVVTQNDIGSAPNEIPLNGHLGGMAYQESDSPTIGKLVISEGVLVANLGTGPIGTLARVTDATSPTVGSTVTGGGSDPALVWYNGTNWTVFGV